MKMFVDVGFVVGYMYASEIYPAVARTTGTSVCIAAGRIGSIACPLVYEYSVRAAQSAVGRCGRRASRAIHAEVSAII